MGVTLPKSRFFHRRIFSTLRCFFIRYSALSPNKASWAFHSNSMHFLNFGTTSWDSPLTMSNCCREIYVPMLFFETTWRHIPIVWRLSGPGISFGNVPIWLPFSCRIRWHVRTTNLTMRATQTIGNCLTSLGLQVYNHISMVSGGQSMYIYIYIFWLWLLYIYIYIITI